VKTSDLTRTAANLTGKWIPPDPDLTGARPDLTGEGLNLTGNASDLTGNASDLTGTAVRSGPPCVSLASYVLAAGACKLLCIERDNELMRRRKMAKNPGRSWRCGRCGTLLGVERDGKLHLKYKTAQYLVEGTVTAVCHRCNELCEIVTTRTWQGQDARSEM
jgi:hypothetical protein